MVRGVFPVLGRKGRGFVGYFVKLAAVPMEKTVSLVLIQKSALMKGKSSHGPRQELSNSLNAALENVFPGTTYTSVV